MGVLSLGPLLTLGGLAALLHTTHAVIKHRETLKLSQEEYEGLPPSMLLELLVGMVLATVGAFALSGSLRIAISTRQRATETGSLRMDFISFNTRSKAIPFFDANAIS